MPCAYSVRMMGQKKRLNLSVDAEAVKRARKLDINISDLTERILQSFTVEPGSLGEAEERKEYLRLLATMDPVIRANGIEVPVGTAERWLDDNADDNADDSTEVSYVGGGQFRPKDPNVLGLDLSGDSYDWSLDEIEGQDTHLSFLSPIRIVSNFIEKVNEKKRRREVDLHELRVARNVLEAVLGGEKPSTPPVAELPKQPHRKKRARSRSKGGRP
jgi:hypothetical protein